MDLDRFCELVIPRLREAGQYLRVMRGKVDNIGKDAPSNSDATPFNIALTYMDMFTQDYLMLPIYKEFPFLVPLVEEDTGMKSQYRNNRSDYILTIDPLDGTAMYCQGEKDYSVMIAILHKGKILLGIGYYPETERIYIAINGKGSFYLDSNNVKTPMPSLADIKTDPYNVAVHYRFLTPSFKTLAQNLHSKGYKTPTNVKDFGTNLTGALRIIEGKSCAFIGPHVTLHDFAVPALLVKESGGIIAKFNYKGKDDSISWERTDAIFDDLDPCGPPPRFRIIIADKEATVERILQDMLH